MVEQSELGANSPEAAPSLSAWAGLASNAVDLAHALQNPDAFFGCVVGTLSLVIGWLSGNLPICLGFGAALYLGYVFLRLAQMRFATRREESTHRLEPWPRSF